MRCAALRSGCCCCCCSVLTRFFLSIYRSFLVWCQFLACTSIIVSLSTKFKQISYTSLDSFDFFIRILSLSFLSSFAQNLSLSQSLRPPLQQAHVAPYRVSEAAGQRPESEVTQEFQQQKVNIEWEGNKINEITTNAPKTHKYRRPETNTPQRLNNSEKVLESESI